MTVRTSFFFCILLSLTSCGLRDTSMCQEISDATTQEELLEVLRPEIEFTKQNGYIYKLEALIEVNTPTFFDCASSYVVMFTPKIYPPEAGIVVTGNVQQFFISKSNNGVRGPLLNR